MDSPENIYSQPNNLYVAKLVGSPAMNFFDVLIRQTEKGISIKANSFSIKLSPDYHEMAAAISGETADPWDQT